MPAVDERLERARQKRARLGDASREVRESVITRLDDFEVRSGREQVQATTQQLKSLSNKLEAAKAFGAVMEQELRDLCIGAEEKLQSIGYAVTEAYQFKGSEKVYAFFGETLGFKSQLDKAQRLRLERLRQQSVKQSVDEVAKLILGTIDELGETEKQYVEDIGDVKEKTGYAWSIAVMIKKLKEARPEYEKAKDERERLEGELKNLKMELESGLISATERPAKEAELEELQKAHNDALRMETDMLGIINEAERTIPEVQKAREAAEKTVIAIHGMRRSLLEKQENFKELFERSMTAVYARAKLERYHSLDPILNKTAQLLVENLIKVAGAAMEIAKERLMKAAIDPDESARLSRELLGHVTDFLDGVVKLEEEAERGVRKPVEPAESTGDAGGK